MKDYEREYPLFSACGLNCGLCPRYHTKGTSRCPGCAGKGFEKVHPSCGVLSCSQREGVDYCYLCDEFPCKKYHNADQADSFITQKNQLKDLERAKSIGLKEYQSELDRKVDLLEFLLNNYNDGRRKNFYCIAVNLLPLSDVDDIIKVVEEKISPHDIELKSKIEQVVVLFKDKAQQRNIDLTLRKKPLCEAK